MSTPRSSPTSYVQKVNLAKIKDGGVVYFLVVFRQILLATSLVTRVVLWYPVIKMLPFTILVKGQSPPIPSLSLGKAKGWEAVRWLYVIFESN